MAKIGSGNSTWAFKLGDGNNYSLKKMTTFIDSIIVERSYVGDKTLRNNLVPLKIGIFVWRVLKERIAVKLELVKRGVNLASLLCPICNKEVESTSHALITCEYAKDVWSRIHNWWSLNFIPSINIESLLKDPNCNTLPRSLQKTWQAISWTTAYFIWKNRNQKFFNNDSWSTAKLTCDIQVKSFEWIMNRSSKINKDWLQWLLNSINLGAPNVNNLDPG
ncbi:uncharacterized protein [Rutidosis leptorrhynchoides]|uniref:uncharacterized protein n=1 Tax=Rutidosis leptorrhynchoides TaxID=125765 RepID=UPI003A98E610